FPAFFSKQLYIRYSALFVKIFQRAATRRGKPMDTLQKFLTALPKSLMLARVEPAGVAPTKKRNLARPRVGFFYLARGSAGRVHFARCQSARWIGGMSATAIKFCPRFFPEIT